MLGFERNMLQRTESWGRNPNLQCSAHRLEIAFGSLRRLRFRGLPAGHPASLRTPFAFSGLRLRLITLRTFAPPYVKSLSREGPGKAYAATPKQLTYAKPERIDPDAYVPTEVFLFWFVFSFCVFNLLHAFKSLALFPPFGENGRSLFRRDFGSSLLFVVLELFHKNKPLTTLRCRSLLFLLLRVSVRCAHRLEIAFGSLRRLRFRGLPTGHPASLRTPFAFSGLRLRLITLRNFASGNLGIDKQISRSSKRKVSLSRGVQVFH